MSEYIQANPGDITSASEIVVSAYEYLAPTALEVRYPELIWDKFIPIASLDTAVPEGDDVYSKRIKDYRGVGSFRAVGSNDVNTVSFTQTKISTPMFNGAVATALDVQDIARAESAKMRALGESAVQLATDAMATAADRHIEKLFLFGDNIKDAGANNFYSGLLDNAFIPQATVPIGASGGTEWIPNGTSGKTADEIINDIVIGINTVYSNTRTITRPDWIGLPARQFSYITSLKAGDRANDEVVWKFISQQNVTVAIDGRDINIQPLRYLEAAGAGGTDRMLIGSSYVDNYLVGMSIPYRQFNTQLIFYQQYLLGEYKVSPLVITYPLAFAYLDGI